MCLRLPEIVDVSQWQLMKACGYTLTQITNKRTHEQRGKAALSCNGCTCDPGLKSVVLLSSRTYIGKMKDQVRF